MKGVNNVAQLQEPTVSPRAQNTSKTTASLKFACSPAETKNLFVAGKRQRRE